jgi:hypothetical protein
VCTRVKEFCSCSRNFEDNVPSLTPEKHSRLLVYARDLSGGSVLLRPFGFLEVGRPAALRHFSLGAGLRFTALDAMGETKMRPASAS